MQMEMSVYRTDGNQKVLVLTFFTQQLLPRTCVSEGCICTPLTMLCQENAFADYQHVSHQISSTALKDSTRSFKISV